MREELTLNYSELEWTTSSTNYVHITVLLVQGMDGQSVIYGIGQL